MSLFTYYRRKTHTPNGLYRGPFSAEAKEYCDHSEAGFIIHMLESDRWMDADEIYVECTKQNLQDVYEECQFSRSALEVFLSRLIKYDMAEQLDTDKPLNRKHS